MMDWTDRHCRFFLRVVAPRARLYTEMIPAGTLLHGDRRRHLAFDITEHPVAAQLGGSDPHQLAACARLAEQEGYDEINLNVGCPSKRVQNGAFGACLMVERELVAECVRAMRDEVGIPVTVKHRIGIGRTESYEFLRDFVGTVAAAGCTTFIVHARTAILSGFTPKENREIPPLRYDLVHRLKREFPRLTIVLNGGLAAWDSVAAQLEHVDGVMIGRAAYHHPWFLAEASVRLFGEAGPVSRVEVVNRMFAYAEREVRTGVALRHITRHMLGLYHGHQRARVWRRALSDAQRLARNDPRLLLDALNAVEGPAKAAA